MACALSFDCGAKCRQPVSFYVPAPDGQLSTSTFANGDRMATMPLPAQLPHANTPEAFCHVHRTYVDICVLARHVCAQPILRYGSKPWRDAQPRNAP